MMNVGKPTSLLMIGRMGGDKGGGGREEGISILKRREEGHPRSWAVDTMLFHCHINSDTWTSQMARSRVADEDRPHRL